MLFGRLVERLDALEGSRQKLRVGTRPGILRFVGSKDFIPVRLRYTKSQDLGCPVMNLLKRKQFLISPTVS